MPCLLFSPRLLTIVLTVVLAAQAPKAADAPLHDLIELLDDPSPTAIADAESIYGQLTKDGASSPKGAYALALLCTREGKLDRAVELLGSMPNEAKLALPVLRLRLWLALERAEKEMAERLFNVVRDQIANGKLTEADRLGAIRLLGGIAGILPTGNASTISESLITQTVKVHSSPADQKASSLFRSAQQSALKRRQQLDQLLVEVKGDKEAAQMRLTEAESKRQDLDQTLKEAEAELKAGLSAYRADEKKTQPQTRLLGREALALRRESNLETPGKPRAPVKPSLREPIRPRAPTRDSKGNVSQQEQSRYETALRQYDLDLRTNRNKMEQFNEELRTFPIRLADWQARDKQRRETLQSKMNDVQTKLAAAKAAEDAREAAIDALRMDYANKQTAARDLDLTIRLLRTIDSSNVDDARQNVLTQPSSYDLLSFTSERQRLLQSLKADSPLDN